MGYSLAADNEGYSFAAGHARLSLSLPGRSCNSSRMLFEIFYQLLQAWRFQFSGLLTTIVGSLLKQHLGHQDSNKPEDHT
jgi:hypothetical protein